jgi:hypothetical protein
MLAAYNALQKNLKSDEKQVEWKFNLVRKFLESGYKTTKIRRILNFIRYYLTFNKPETEQTYEKQLSTIIQEPRNMGIEEVILEALKEQVTAEVTAEVTEKVTQQVTQQVVENAVRKMIEYGMTNEVIMNIHKVDEAFIEQLRQSLR